MIGSDGFLLGAQRRVEDADVAGCPGAGLRRLRREGVIAREQRDGGGGQCRLPGAREKQAAGEESEGRREEC